MNMMDLRYKTNSINDKNKQLFESITNSETYYMLMEMIKDDDYFLCQKSRSYTFKFVTARDVDILYDDLVDIMMIQKNHRVARISTAELRMCMGIAIGGHMKSPYFNWMMETLVHSLILVLNDKKIIVCVIDTGKLFSELISMRYLDI